mmetsp:Transcript_54284/g.118975  ORF Transcript_54284/g.118975 Transcript_54284/m.118975 type:complete len:600 (+) Transcript_54284:1027-2826(+)
MCSLVGHDVGDHVLMSNFADAESAGVDSQDGQQIAVRHAVLLDLSSADRTPELDRSTRDGFCKVKGALLEQSGRKGTVSTDTDLSWRAWTALDSSGSGSVTGERWMSALETVDVDAVALFDQLSGDQGLVTWEAFSKVMGVIDDVATEMRNSPQSRSRERTQGRAFMRKPSMWKGLESELLVNPDYVEVTPRDWEAACREFGTTRFVPEVVDKATELALQREIARAYTKTPEGRRARLTSWSVQRALVKLESCQISAEVKSLAFEIEALRRGPPLGASTPSTPSVSSRTPRTPRPAVAEVNIPLSVGKRAPAYSIQGGGIRGQKVAGADFPGPGAHDVCAPTICLEGAGATFTRAPRLREAAGRSPGPCAHVHKSESSAPRSRGVLAGGGRHAVGGFLHKVESSAAQTPAPNSYQQQRGESGFGLSFASGPLPRRQKRIAGKLHSFVVPIKYNDPGAYPRPACSLAPGPECDLPDFPQTEVHRPIPAYSVPRKKREKTPGWFVQCGTPAPCDHAAPVEANRSLVVGGGGVQPRPCKKADFGNGPRFTDDVWYRDTVLVGRREAAMDVRHAPQFSSFAETPRTHAEGANNGVVEPSQDCD